MRIQPEFSKNLTRDKYCQVSPRPVEFTALLLIEESYKPKMLQVETLVAETPAVTTTSQTSEKIPESRCVFGEFLCLMRQIRRGMWEFVAISGLCRNK